MKGHPTEKVLIAMSGGVDSSVAAALILEQGYEAFGVTMRIWAGAAAKSQSGHHGCYGPEEEEDIEDARRVAKQLGLPYHVIDLTHEYQDLVLDYFSQEYSCGRTPNPCVRCNQQVKFGALIQKARESGLEFDRIASGHYARIKERDGRFILSKAQDLSKDQSYFLAFLSQDQLSQLMFPLGELTKVGVRDMATKLGIAVADKPDSQNFISGDYAELIQSPSKPGPIIDRSGNILGRHQGLQHYTIGQRKGLNIAAAEPLYVTALDAAQNTLTVGLKQDIYQREFRAINLNWIASKEVSENTNWIVKIRSGHPGAEAEIRPSGQDTLQVRFKQPQMAITPGQAAVFYQNDEVLAGALIGTVSPNE